MKTNRYLFLDELMHMFDARRQIVTLAGLNSNETALTVSDQEKTKDKMSTKRPASRRQAVAQFAQAAS